MYVTTGTIEDLMQWFNRKNDGIMCLFVGGSLNDKEILEEILNQRDAFNTISGENVYFFLFWDKQNELFSINHVYGYTQVFYGADLKKIIYPIERYRISDRHAFSEMISKSQNISIEICKYFKIDATCLPCMLIIERGNEKHYILQLKNRYSTQGLFNFFKEIREIADKISSIKKDIQQDEYNNRKKDRLLKRKIDIEQSMPRVVENDSNYKQKCNDLFFFLEKNGANDEKLKQIIISKTYHIRKEIRKYIEANFPNETRRHFQSEVFGNKEYKRLINEVQLASINYKKYIDYQSALLKWKKELNDLEYELKNIPNPIPENVFQSKKQEKQKELEKLENKYEQIVNKYTLFFLGNNIINTMTRFINQDKLFWLFRKLFNL